MAQANKDTIRRFYHELWNRWDLGVAEAIVASDIRFRGSLGTSVEGIDRFKNYMRTVRGAFPDFHNEVEEMIAEGDTVAARLTYTGTHKGEILGLAPTGRRITYQGIAIFRITQGKIRSGWVLGDLAALQSQLTGER